MTKEEIKAREKEEKDIIKSVIYPKIPKEYPHVETEIRFLYKRFRPIMSLEEVKRLIDRFMFFKYRDTEKSSTYYNIPVETWATSEEIDLWSKHCKCTNPDCNWECPRIEAITGLYHYCAKCGKLLPYREEVRILYSSEYEALKENAEKSGLKKLKETIFW